MISITQFKDRYLGKHPSYALFILIIAIAGILLRLRSYLSFRSLWLDEAMLARNIVERPLGRLLFTPLDYNQGAPIGFLFFQKLATLSFGAGEAVIRAIPLIAGILTIFWMFWVSLRSIGKMGAVIALVFLVLSPSLIYYSSEVKQYSSDVFIGLLILSVFLILLRSPQKKNAYTWLAVVGIFAGAFSHPALFLLFGAGLTLLLKMLLSKDYPSIKRLAVVTAIWLAFYLGLYLVSLRNLSANSRLLNYWSSQFMPMPPWKDFHWFAMALDELAVPYSLPVILPTRIFALLLTASVISLFWRNRWLGLFFILVFTSTLAASSLRLYPFGGRLILFLYPFLFLLAAELAQRLYDWLRLIDPAGAIALATILVLLLFTNVAQVDRRNFLSPPMGEDFKAVYSAYKDHKSQGDALYIYYSAQMAYFYYHDVYGIGGQNVFIGNGHRNDPEIYLKELEEVMQQNKQVWFLFTHNCPTCKVDEELFMLNYLDRIAQRTAEYHASEASLYRYILPASP